MKKFTMSLSSPVIHHLDRRVKREGGATYPWPCRLPHISVRCTYAATVTGLNPKTPTTAASRFFLFLPTCP